MVKLKLRLFINIITIFDVIHIMNLLYGVIPAMRSLKKVVIKNKN